MKKIYTLLSLLLLSGISFGKQVDVNTAKNIAQAFLSASGSPSLKSAANLQLVYSAGTGSGNAASPVQPSVFYYVFNAAQQGFVIVAADDAATPVLGYSDRGAFDPANVPPNVAKWMEGYKSEIRYLVEHQINPTREIEEQWLQLKRGEVKNTSGESSVTAVGPLMQTRWNQSPYYNAMCPGGSVTGCVATAMAQVMKYWNYPSTGSGFHSFNHSRYGTLSANFGSTTYQWANMTNTLSSANNAVATLMYQVGVSVDMDYSPESSGAYVISAQSPVTNCAEYALKTYFGYKNTLKGVQRSSYTQTQWMNLLKTELDAGRPVLYAGFGSGGGHCFVADGYDVNNYFHFNWGWGGAYDGYFQVNALNPSGTGIGGGSGGFNSGHQAVIGIEPPSVTQTFNLALYAALTPSATTIYYGGAFSITTNVVNKGTATFSGDYAVAVFDNAYNFVDFVETKTGFNLQGGYVYSNNLVFSSTGLLSMLPGKYYAGIFYRPAGGNWVQVDDNGSYSNLVSITVTNPNTIELNADFTVTPGTILTKGSPASVNLNIRNDGSASFKGQYAVDLYTLDGNWAQSIGTVDESEGLPAGYTYVAPYLTFATNNITVEPGTYLMAVMHKAVGGSWELSGSSYFQNPIKVTVVAASIQPDIFEDNNTVSQAYSLPVTFSGNTATGNTSGSNCHITTDNDFYKIVLPAGYNYTITPRLRDSYNSGNGIIYTLDGLFSYSTDGTSWSEAFDDVIPGSISVTSGGTVYFHIAPYFAGETGTYQLDIALTRISTVGIDTETQNVVKIYPNPAKEHITLDGSGFSGIISQVSLINMQGNRVFTQLIGNNSEVYNISLPALSAGVYTVQLVTSQGILNRKINISR